MSNEFIISKTSNEIIYSSTPDFKSYLKRNTFFGYNIRIDIFHNKLICFVGDYQIEIILVKDYSIIDYSSNGIVLKNSNNILKGTIKIPSCLSFKCNNRYISINKSPIAPLLLINPLVNKGEYDDLPLCIYKIIDKETIEFEIVVNKQNDLIVEIYGHTDKLFFDTVIESYSENRNNVYTSVAYLSNKNNKEELLIRLNYVKFNDIQNKKIKNAYLYLKVLRKNNDCELAINEINNLWCSFNTTWNIKPKIKKQKINYNLQNNYLKIDVTSLIDFNKINHPGLIIKSINGFVSVVTSDSYYYKSYLQILL